MPGYTHLTAENTEAREGSYPTRISESRSQGAGIGAPVCATVHTAGGSQGSSPPLFLPAPSFPHTCHPQKEANGTDPQATRISTRGDWAPQGTFGMSGDTFLVASGGAGGREEERSMGRGHYQVQWWRLGMLPSPLGCLGRSPPERRRVT